MYWDESDADSMKEKKNRIHSTQSFIAWDLHSERWIILPLRTLTSNLSANLKEGNTDMDKMAISSLKHSLGKYHMAEIDGESKKKRSFGMSFRREKPAYMLDMVLLMKNRLFIIVTTVRECGFPQEHREGTTFTPRTFGLLRIHLRLCCYFKAAFPFLLGTRATTNEQYFYWVTQAISAALTDFGVETRHWIFRIWPVPLR